MRKRTLFMWLSGALAATAIAGAVSAPAEVLEDLEFFSDFELVSNLDLLEGEEEAAEPAPVSTAPAASTAAVAGSSVTVKVSTAAWRAYEKR